MKSSIVFSIACLGLLLGSSAFAYSMEFEAERNSENFCSECQCTARGYYYNDCLTKREYCKSFGNIGLR
ncbi:MAG: hypothetical protein A3E85_00530 [Gammaproteobacteria bacterium RIFCSPHIGHO2_12_FULL_45_12]|nr:MAG: hypothetical protein A3E85_00530 [Gammaproteobacteria bacterium RIFCSPHIGHO2_12_FULL_45_12]